MTVVEFSVNMLAVLGTVLRGAAAGARRGQLGRWRVASRARGRVGLRSRAGQVLGTRAGPL